VATRSSTPPPARARDTEATPAVHAWLAERSPANRQAAIEALQALDDL
jgi:hypothetical protein